MDERFERILNRVAQVVSIVWSLALLVKFLGG